jgi:sulfate adenylyltransferase small subunit
MNDVLTHRTLTHLERLEAEAIQIMREVVAECDRPVMLYSIGKDSAVMLYLALKAFYPAKLPFPLLHVDTKWKFREMYAFRDRMMNEHGFDLLVYTNPEGLAQGINPFTHGSAIHTDVMKTQALKQALDLHGFDAAFGGARRDEEKSRAKERIFSFRSAQHRWDPKTPAPGAVAHLQRAQAQERVDPRVPDVELDRARHLAVHLPARHPDRAAVLLGRAACRRARRHVDHGGRRPHAALPGREAT